MSCFDKRILAKFFEVMFTRENLHLYQSDEAIPFLYENPFSALFIDMGLGKTISALTVVVDLLNETHSSDPVLIIGPMRVATQTWPTEIGRWEHTAPFNHSLIYAADDHPDVLRAYRDAKSFGRTEGLSANEIEAMAGRAITAEKDRIRKRAVLSKAPIHIVPSEWVEWLCNHWRGKWPYRTVIIDESSQFKDFTTNRFNAIKKICNTPGLITRLHLLTATPAAESYEHLYSQIWLLDRGKRLGKNITYFRNKWFTYDRYKRKYFLRPDAEEEILEKISDICLVMKAEDYIDLEKPVISARPVTLSAAQMELYNTMANDFVVTLDDGTVIEAETAAALSSKLLQMSSGVLYETYLEGDYETEDMRKVKRVHKLHDHKIDELRQIISENPGKPILVGYHFKSSLDRLKTAFPEAVMMDKAGKCIKKWNKGKIPILLMHPQSGGHGLNLQEGGHNIVFFDIPWSLELYLQFIGRLARQGQKHVVIVQLLAAVGTLDWLVFSALNTKNDAQEKLLRMLKRMIKAARKAKLEMQALLDDEI